MRWGCFFLGNRSGTLTNTARNHFGSPLTKQVISLVFPFCLSYLLFGLTTEPTHLKTNYSAESGTLIPDALYLPCRLHQGDPSKLDGSTLSRHLTSHPTNPACNPTYTPLLPHEVSNMCSSQPMLIHIIQERREVCSYGSQRGRRPPCPLMEAVRGDWPAERDCEMSGIVEENTRMILFPSVPRTVIAVVGFEQRQWTCK